MKKMFEYDLVRRMYYRDDLTRREINRLTGHHRETIKKMLKYPSPPGYRLQQPRTKSKLDPYLPIIDKILEDDRSMSKKQRHTAKRIFDRLKAEHDFTGGYTIIKDYVREQKLRQKEVFLPLVQRPGTDQVDFGAVKIIIGGIVQDAHMFCMALPYSDAMVVQVYPTEAFEAVAAGHNTAFAFLEGVPPEGLYDNMPTAVKSVGKGHEREVTDDFMALRSHYLFRSCFCNVGRANEKGVVEGLVGYARRNFFVPTLNFPTWEDVNTHLLVQCTKRLFTKTAGKDKTIGELLEEERRTFLPLPAAEFEACRKEGRRVTSLSLVRHKTNSYSVPVEYAYREVTVKVYVFHIKICHKGMVVARHKRSYGRDDFVFNPLHYLPLLEQKPGGLDGARPFDNWELPKCFETLRRYLEGRCGNNGKREYIQVLQLLREFSIPEVRRAIERAFEYSCVTFEAIRLLVMTNREPAVELIPLSEERLKALPRVWVEKTDTACYGALLTGSLS
jgi:transposase